MLSLSVGGILPELGVSQPGEADIVLVVGIASYVFVTVIKLGDEWVTVFVLEDELDIGTDEEEGIEDANGWDALFRILECEMLVLAGTEAWLVEGTAEEDIPCEIELEARGTSLDTWLGGDQALLDEGPAELCEPEAAGKGEDGFGIIEVAENLHR